MGSKPHFFNQGEISMDAATADRILQIGIDSIISVHKMAGMIRMAETKEDIHLQMIIRYVLEKMSEVLNNSQKEIDELRNS